MIVREYAHGSNEYQAALELRREVLRKPLGLTYDQATLDAESTDYHLGAFADGVVVGTLILTPNGPAVKMRQVAVAPDRQNQGIGRVLVDFSEVFARSKGFREIELHARESARPFYEKLGYLALGEPFEEVTIPHRAMKKSLN